MRYSRYLTIFVLSTLAFASSFSRAHAQGPLNGQTVEASGTVVAVNVRVLEVLVTDGTGNRIVLDFKQERVQGDVVIDGLPNPTAHVVGTTTPDVLVAGLMVRARGKVKNMSEFTEPLTEIDITGVGAEPNGSYGAFPDDDIELTPEEQAAGVQGFVISGQIQRIRRGKIHIAIPVQGERETIIAEVADDAVVSIDAYDPRLAGPGDRVDFTGYSLGGEKVFAFTATFTKADPNNPNPDAGRVREQFHGPEGARPPRQAFGAGIPDVGQGNGQAPAEDDPAPAADPAADPAMQEPGEPAEPFGGQPAEAAEPAAPDKPGRVLRLN